MVVVSLPVEPSPGAGDVLQRERRVADGRRSAAQVSSVAGASVGLRAAAAAAAVGIERPLLKSATRLLGDRGRDGGGGVVERRHRQCGRRGRYRAGAGRDRAGASGGCTARGCLRAASLAATCSGCRRGDGQVHASEALFGVFDVRRGGVLQHDLAVGVGGLAVVVLRGAWPWRLRACLLAGADACVASAS